MVKGVMWVIAFCAISMMALKLWNDYMAYTAHPYIYHQTAKIPQKRWALLLGTSKYFRGKQNYFYTYRIDAAARLYHSGKIHAILVSGDGRDKRQSEPKQMQEDLIRRGVPKSAIVCDPLGIRTFDSIVRAARDFHLSSYVIISQSFHLERALYIARAKGHQVVGFIAKDLKGTYAASKMILREYLARFKALIDLYIVPASDY